MSLIEAARAGRAATVRRLLEQGADARARDEEGARALDEAAEGGHLEIVQRLLAHDPGLLDLPGYHGRTALATAAGSGHGGLTSFLLSRGADPHARLHDGTRALDWAASMGHLDGVERLLAHDPQLLDLPGCRGCTPLNMACAGGHLAVARLLLGRGADARLRSATGSRALDDAVQEGRMELVALLLAHDPGLLDLPGHDERTALAAAAGSGHEGLTSFLLARGADPRAQLDDGTRALDWAAQAGHRRIVEILLAREGQLVDLPGPGGHTALMRAAARNHAGIVGVLLAAGADARACARNGMHALDCAAWEGHEEAVTLLLAHDPGLLDLPGRHGRTALAAAAGAGHAALAAVLLARGADPRVQRDDGTRALDWAAENGHEAVVERLLAHDPRLLELPGLSGRTALIAAAGGGHAELVSALLARGADPRRRSCDGGARALDEAAQAGHPEIVARLLAHDPGLLDLPGHHGRRALAAAAGAGHGALVQRLLGHGADARARDEEGSRALDSAAREGHREVVERLLAHDPDLLDLPGGRGTALIAAAGSGDAGLVEALLARGADARAQAAGGARALDRAAAEGHLEAVERLLAQDPQLLDLPGEGGCTALSLACFQGDVAVAGLLLARGADARLRSTEGGHALDAAAQEGWQDIVERLLAHDPGLRDLPGAHERTALIAAAGAGHGDLVRLLLSRGADARARDEEGGRALDAAAREGHQEAVEQLLTHDAGLLDLPGRSGTTALTAAAGGGHAGLVSLLLARGADPRLAGEGGTRALDEAAQQGQQAIIEGLLARDPALLDLPGYHGRSALSAAAGHGHGALVSMLLARGADAAARFGQSARALDWAAQEGHLDVVRRLLAHDPQLLDLPGFRGRTALHMACGCGQLAMARLLLAQGADARLRSSEGARALDDAAQEGWPAIVALLLAHDPGLLELPGGHGRTALMAAAAGGHLEVLERLLAAGADPRHRVDGTSALDLATRNGHIAVGEALLRHGGGLRPG